MLTPGGWSAHSGHQSAGFAFPALGSTERSRVMPDCSSQAVESRFVLSHANIVAVVRCLVLSRRLRNLAISSFPGRLVPSLVTNVGSSWKSRAFARTTLAAPGRSRESFRSRALRFDPRALRLILASFVLTLACFVSTLASFVLTLACCTTVVETVRVPPPKRQ
jgi:hypothetical protein